MKARTTMTLGILGLLMACSTKQAEMENSISYESNDIEREEEEIRSTKEAKRERNAEKDVTAMKVLAEPEPTVASAVEDLMVSSPADMSVPPVRKMETKKKSVRAAKSKKSTPLSVLPSAPPLEETPIVIADTIAQGEEYTDYGINPFVSTK